MDRDKPRGPKPYVAANAQTKAANYCAKQERCRQDLARYLTRLNAPEAEVERITSWLTAEGFLDEQRFALAYARDKSRFEQWGPRKIALMLQRKGIPQELVTQALEAVAEEGNSPDLEALLQKKIRGIPADESYLKAKGKLLRFAANRGFTPEQSYRAVEHVLREQRPPSSDDEY